MEREKDQIQQWLDTAVSGVRFRPDREAVEQELREHLEDKTEDLTRIFQYNEEEAQAQALETMGDPEVLREELARIHKPWLGYLWTWSKRLLGLVCTGLVVILFWYGDDAYLGEDHYGELWDWDNRPKFVGQLYDSPGDDPDQLWSVEYQEKVHISGQTIALRRGTLWQREEGLELYLYLRLDTWRCWARGELQSRWLTVTDSLGNQMDFSGVEEIEGLQGFSRFQPCGGGPFHQGYQLALRDMDPAAQWVRLDYGWPEPFFSLTADLTGEGEP